jgi:hypothetical protein
MPCSQRPKVFCHCFHVRHIAVWIVANRFFVRDRLGSMAIVTRFPQAPSTTVPQLYLPTACRAALRSSFPRVPPMTGE